MKHVGKRYATDINDLIAPGYTVTDLDVRFSLAKLGLPQTYLQANVTNLFDERYFSTLSTATTSASTTRYTFGAPRAVIGSIHFQF